MKREYTTAPELGPTALKLTLAWFDTSMTNGELLKVPARVPLASVSEYCLVSIAIDRIPIAVMHKDCPSARPAT